MSSNDLSRRAALLAVLGLAGCGFAPAFVPGGSAAQWQNAVIVDAPETPMGFRMGARLRETLGAPSAAKFTMMIAPQAAPVPATITEEGDITRLNLTGNATWQIKELATGAVVEEGLVQTFTSYSATGSTVATQAAETDALERLSVALADLIVQQLLTAL